MIEEVVSALLLEMGTLTQQIGILLVAVLGLAVGIYGARLAWGIVTSFVRARVSHK